jgi:arginine/lysine/ornithine decarboxylase
LLLASLEAAAEQAAREGLGDELREETEALRAALGDDLRLLSRADIGRYGISGLDWSRLLVNTRPLGIGAPEAVDWLRTQEGVEPELWDGENILFLLGVGSTAADVRRLRHSLENIVRQFASGANRRKAAAENPFYTAGELPLPPVRLTPREAWLAPKYSVPLSAAAGCVAGETVSVYPPGIPLVMAGEEIGPAIIELWQEAADRHWQGWSGRAGGTVLVVREGGG